MKYELQPVENHPFRDNEEVMTESLETIADSVSRINEELTELNLFKRIELLRFYLGDASVRNHFEDIYSLRWLSLHDLLFKDIECLKKLYSKGIINGIERIRGAL